MQQIGQLFLLRMNINLVGSVLDSPVGIILSPILSPMPLISTIGAVLGMFVK